MDQTRRDFVLKLVKGAAYAAPVVVSLATPVGLAAQGQGQLPASQKKQNQDVIQTDPAALQSPIGPTAPWEVVPPGSLPDEP